MAHEKLIADVEEGLAVAALADAPLTEALRVVGRTLRAGGVAVSRCYVAWKLVHPLYRAANISWESSDDRVESEHWGYTSDPAVWDNSPLKAFLETNEGTWIRDLRDPAVRASFEAFQKHAAAGHTGYFATKVGFGSIADYLVKEEDPGSPGVIVSFCTDAPGGFADDDIATLSRLKYMIALASRMTIQRGVSEAIAVTYLGETAGRHVLDGAIRLGDGVFEPAVIWFADMRGSTALAEALSPPDYVALLNRFFAATAGAATDAGGEILDFIGDAVLAVFPEGPAGVSAAVAAADDALARLEPLRGPGGLPASGPLAGIAIASGTMMFGNIGIASRLSFSVIGSTVNLVARIEALTKTLRESLLVTESIASAAPDRWASRGMHRLPGIAHPVPLFAPIAREGEIAV